MNHFAPVILAAAIALGGCATLGIPTTPKTVRQGTLAMEKGYQVGAGVTLSLCAPVDVRPTCVKARSIDGTYVWPALKAAFTGALITTPVEGDPSNEELSGAHSLSTDAHNALHGIVAPPAPAAEPVPESTPEPVVP